MMFTLTLRCSNEMMNIVYLCPLIYTTFPNPGLILVSSVSYPGSTGYYGAKPGSSVVNSCSSVGHPCASVTLPGVVRG